MKKPIASLAVSAVILAGAILTAQPAQAHDHVDIGVGFFGGPGYYARPYYEPAYYAPPPVVYAPAPVYRYVQPVNYVYAPRPYPVGYGPGVAYYYLPR